MAPYWFEQDKANLPPGDSWLSEREAIFAHTLRFEKRRADWLLGRWTAKNALAIFLNLSSTTDALREIEIRPAPSGAPRVFILGEPARISVSLSHRATLALCALADSSVLLGCDLEIAEAHSKAFEEDYFTPAEQLFVAGHSPAERARLLTLFWSGKESALKAIGEGLRVDTRRLAVSLPLALSFDSANDENTPQRHPACHAIAPQSVTWRPLIVRHVDGHDFFGWWSHSGTLVRTIVTDPPSSVPECLLRPEPLRRVVTLSSS